MPNCRDITLSLNFFYLFEILNVLFYMKDKMTGRERGKKRERERKEIEIFQPLVQSPDDQLGLIQVEAGSLELHHGLPCAWRNARHLGYLLLPSQVH